MCHNKESHFDEPSCEAKSQGMRSCIRSAGFMQGTSPCCPSAWGEENGIDHDALESIDQEIQRSVNVILPRELQILDVYHQNGILRKTESQTKSQCRIL